MKKLIFSAFSACMLSCNGQDALTKGLTTSADKIPLTIKNFYQDNNYMNQPGTLVDGNLSTSFFPAWNLIYMPHDVVVDLSDFNATVKKIRIFDSNGDGYKTKLILVRKEDEKEVEVGEYTGSEYNKWVEFTPPSHFIASRFIMRGGANACYGNELELIGDHIPYKEPVYNRPRQPLKNMLGVNAHWWDFLSNQQSKETSVVPAKYNAFLSLNLTSLRNYGNASEYQPVKGKWAFNPVRQGWYEEELFKKLKADRPDMIRWSVMQGQFDFVRDSWKVPDESVKLKGTVVDYIDRGGWGSLTIKFTGGTGVETRGREWHIKKEGKIEEGQKYSTGSNTQFTVPSKFPKEQGFAVGGKLSFKKGDEVVVTKGQRSELNIYLEDNNKRHDPATWQTLGEMAFVTAARKGKNKNVPDYGLWSHVDFDEKAWWIAKNEMIKGGDVSDLFEGMNEPNAWWAGYDDFVSGKDLGAAWSMMYDGHKGRFPGSGVKTADPGFKMSTSGLATATTDIMREVYWWSKRNRGLLPNGSVDLPFDIIQFHNYSYTGGVNQYAGGVQAGLPPELSNVLDAVDEFVWYSNKYAGGREVWCGEWGYDVNPESPMNAPAYGGNTAEETRGSWAVRTILEFSAHGLDRAQWYRLYQDDSETDNNATQFGTMSLLKENNDKTITRRLVGDYFRQMAELGDYVFESRLSGEPRVLKFRDGKKIMLAIWAVEKMDIKKGERPVFTETKGVHRLTLPGSSSISLKELVPGDAMSSKPLTPKNGTVTINYSAKPVFVCYTEN